MTSFTGDRLGLEWRVFVTVQGASNRSGPAGVAEQALWCNRPVEIGRRRFFVVGRHVPNFPFRVPGYRRLKKIVSILNEKAERMISRAYGVGNGMLHSDAVPLDLLKQLSAIPADGEF